MRKLASIQKVAEIKAIPNSDYLEAVRVNGWWCVTKKGELSVGQYCVYFEIDSVLPIDDRYEFLRKSSYVKKDWVEGFRLRSIKLRGQLSQGLVMPVWWANESGEYTEGQDLTEHLGVKLWDPPVPGCIAGQVKGNFPSFLRKTDQERVQNLSPESLAQHQHDLFEASLKIDGTSCTIYYNIDADSMGVCSRNLELKVNDENANNSLVKLALSIEPNLRTYCRLIEKSIALQGEVAGPGIQGNKLGFKGVGFWLFDIWDITRQRYYNADERREAAYQMNLVHVPILGHHRVLDNFNLDKLLEMAATISAFNEPGLVELPPSAFEGLVFKSLNDPSFSFKVINNNYLLNND